MDYQLNTPSLDHLVESSSLCEWTHTPHLSSPAAIASLLSGLYPREHHLYGDERYLHPEMNTLVEDFSNLGHRTIILNGHQSFPENGIFSRFDEIIQGPFGRMVERVRTLNQRGIPVFGVLYTNDLSPPYMLSKFPPSKRYHLNVLEVVQEFCNRHSLDHSFRLQDIQTPTDHWQIPWIGDMSGPFWQFMIQRIHGDYQMTDSLLEESAPFLADLYVRGVNNFDQFQLQPLVDFLKNSSSSRPTTLLLTGDRGDVPFTQSRNSDEAKQTFGRSEKPVEEAIRVPLVVYNSHDTWRHNQSVTSLVDIRPSLLDDLGQPLPQEISGSSLLEPISEGRRVFTESSRSTEKETNSPHNDPSEAKSFPRKTIVLWSSVLGDNGLKLNQSGCGLENDLFDRELKKFLHRIMAELSGECLSEEELTKKQESIDDSPVYRQRLLQTLRDRYPKQPLELIDWRQDPFERNNLLESDAPIDLDSIREMRTALQQRFPCPIDLEETPLPEKSTPEEVVSTKNPMESVGYVE